MLLRTLSKNYTTLRKKLKVPGKTPPKYLQKLYPDFSEEGKEEMSVGHVGAFRRKLCIAAYTSKF